MNRVCLLLLSMAFTFAVIALGTIAFGWAPPSVTDFILMAFIGAWCGDQDAAMRAYVASKFGDEVPDEVK